MHDFADQTAPRKVRRRRHPRVESIVPLYFQGRNCAGRSHTTDLSLTGARLTIYGEEEPDDELQVTLNLGQQANLTVTARCVWRVKNGSGHTVGVEFTNTGVGGRAALINYLSEQTPAPEPVEQPKWAKSGSWEVGSCGGPRGAHLN
jgi:hypothetical protein